MPYSGRCRKLLCNTLVNHPMEVFLKRLLLSRPFGRQNYHMCHMPSLATPLMTTLLKHEGTLPHKPLRNTCESFFLDGNQRSTTLSLGRTNDRTKQALGKCNIVCTVWMWAKQKGPGSRCVRTAMSCRKCLGPGFMSFSSNLIHHDIAGTVST